MGDLHPKKKSLNGCKPGTLGFVVDAFIPVRATPAIYQFLVELARISPTTEVGTVMCIIYSYLLASNAMTH